MAIQEWWERLDYISYNSEKNVFNLSGLQFNLNVLNFVQVGLLLQQPGDFFQWYLK